jgi:hypothetical protein
VVVCNVLFGFVVDWFRNLRWCASACCFASHEKIFFFKNRKFGIESELIRTESLRPHSSSNITAEGDAAPAAPPGMVPTDYSYFMKVEDISDTFLHRIFRQSIIFLEWFDSNAYSPYLRVISLPLYLKF